MKIDTQKLSAMIQCETISSRTQTDLTKFFTFHELLKELFPTFFATVQVEVIEGSLLMKWEGSHKWPDNSSPLLPVMFMSHHDVVEATGEWTHGAFSGEIADGCVWGRGTLDTKGNLWAMISAAEQLMEEGFIPTRDYYFTSTCNEETTGKGARAIVTLLKSRGVTLDLLLDEGGMIVPEPMSGVNGTYAMIGIAEKGCMTLKFSAKGPGGHGSTPGKNTPWIQLSKFMLAVEKHSVFTSQMQPATIEMLRCFAPSMTGPMKFIFQNSKYTSRLLTKIMPTMSGTGAALVQTTIAFTMGKGANGHNVIPQEAWVTGDMRFSLHQGRDASVKSITEFAAKYGIETEVIEDGVTASVTDFNGSMFQLVDKTIRDVFPDVLVTPYIMLGASDSRFFGDICENCIRFAPFRLDVSQLGTIHGIDENISISTLEPAVQFFANIMQTV